MGAEHTKAPESRAQEKKFTVEAGNYRLSFSSESEISLWVDTAPGLFTGKGHKAFSIHVGGLASRPDEIHYYSGAYAAGSILYQDCDVIPKEELEALASGGDQIMQLKNILMVASNFLIRSQEDRSFVFGYRDGQMLEYLVEKAYQKERASIKDVYDAVTKLGAKQQAELRR